MAHPNRYASSQIVVHWLMALIIVILFFVGLYSSSLPPEADKSQILTMHKTFGMIALMLLALRLVLRMSCGAPELPASMTPGAKKAAQLGHLALYLLMLAVPMSGWAMSSAAGRPPVLFGAIPLPALMPPNRELAGALYEAHGLLNWLLAATVVGHILAAIKHQLLDKDNLMARMSLRR